nr:transposon Ty3-G Gag-Pol polyprotein [Tanacetum cinerariifolium]
MSICTCRTSLSSQVVSKRVLRIFLENLPEHPSDTKVFTMKMEILLEPTSNKLLKDSNYLIHFYRVVCFETFRSLEFQPGDHVFLKVSPACGVKRFSIKGKLSPRFIGPFEILDRVGEKNLRQFWIVKIESRGKRLFLSLRFFGGTIPSGKPLGKPRSLFGLLILISFHDLRMAAEWRLEDGDSSGDVNGGGGVWWWQWCCTTAAGVIMMVLAVCRWRWRVVASDILDRIDRLMERLFGFAGKSPPEKFFGGGGGRPAAAGRWRE